jgi:hypothetical protein
VKIRFILAFLLVILLGCSALFVNPARASDISIGVTQSFLEFTTGRDGKPYTDAIFQVSGGSKADISFEITDIYIDSSGTKQMLPVNSTPNSPKNYFRLGEFEKTYVANGKTQDLKIRLTLDDPSKVTEVINGGVKIKVDPTAYGKNTTIKSSTGIVLTFVYLPPNLKGTSIIPKLNFSNFDVEKISSRNLIDRLIPDIPSWVHAGPVAISYQRENTGNIFLTVSEKLSIVPRSLFSKSETSTALFTATSANRLIIPNQRSVSSFQVVDLTRNTNQQVNPLKWGIYTVSVEAVGKTGEKVVLKESNSRVLIVFPWKYALVLVILAGLYFIGRRLRARFKTEVIVDAPAPVIQVERAPAKKAPAKKAPAKKAPAKKAPAKKAPAKKAKTPPLRSSQ